jgi:hypothetical protein
MSGDFFSALAKVVEGEGLFTGSFMILPTERRRVVTSGDVR